MVDGHSTMSLVVSVIGLLATTVVAAFVVGVLYTHWLHKKYAHIPSAPRRGFFSGHLLTLIQNYQSKNRCFNEMLLDMMREYGPVFHVFVYFFPIVIVLDPDFVKDMLGKNDHRKPVQFYEDVAKVCGTRFCGSGLVTEMDPVKHAKRRALLNPAFHRKYLQSLMNEFNHGADALIENLTNRADGKTEVVMLNELNKATLNVIAKVAFNLDLNPESNGDSRMNTAFKTVFRGVAAGRENPYIHFSPRASDRKICREVKEAITTIRETGRGCIEKRQLAIEHGETVPQDILTFILEETKKVVGEETMTMEDLLDDFTTFFVAGQETMATMLSFTLIELGHHPEIMHRLRTEVEAVIVDDYVGYGDLGKLEYMMQVFKESLRLWPPASITSRQMAYDVTVKGIKIPSKTAVLTSTYVMCRMEENFKDPLQFDPDRFKTSDDKRPGAYIPFAMGARSCIGQQFAMINARVLLAKLLKKFHFSLVPGQNYDVQEEAITLKPKGGCRNYLRLVE